jgi:hypothetical protein
MVLIPIFQYAILLFFISVRDSLAVTRFIFYETSVSSSNRARPVLLKTDFAIVTSLFLCSKDVKKFIDFQQK